MNSNKQLQSEQDLDKMVKRIKKLKKSLVIFNKGVDVLTLSEFDKNKVRHDLNMIAMADYVKN